MLEQLLHFERDLFFFLNGSDWAALDHFFYVYSYKWTWVPLYLCFLVILVLKKRWQEIVLILAAVGLVVLLCDQISSGILKPYFHRFRPTHHPDFQTQVETVLGYRGGRYGFVSSHAANAAGFSTFMALLFRNRIFTWTFVLFALLNAYSRVYLGVHFISDVVAGAMIGVVVGVLVYELYNKLREKWLKEEKAKLRCALYPVWNSYFLCAAYSVSVVVILIIDNQLIDTVFAVT